MPRRFISCKDNDYKYDLSDCSRVIVREESLVDSFYCEEQVCPSSGKPTFCYTDPLIMLFNQERLSQMGDAAIKMWLDSLSHSTTSAMSDLKSKLSDDDLISLVKSRHIQQPSELQAYAEWCNENMDEFAKEVQALQSQQLSDQSQQLSDKVKESETKTE